MQDVFHKGSLSTQDIVALITILTMSGLFGGVRGPVASGIDRSKQIEKGVYVQKNKNIYYGDRKRRQVN